MTHPLGFELFSELGPPRQVEPEQAGAGAGLQAVERVLADVRCGVLQGDELAC